MSRKRLGPHCGFWEIPAPTDSCLDNGQRVASRSFLGPTSNAAKLLETIFDVCYLIQVKDNSDFEDDFICSRSGVSWPCRSHVIENEGIVPGYNKGRLLRPNFRPIRYQNVGIGNRIRQSPVLEEICAEIGTECTEIIVEYENLFNERIDFGSAHIDPESEAEQQWLYPPDGTRFTITSQPSFAFRTISNRTFCYFSEAPQYHDPDFPTEPNSGQNVPADLAAADGEEINSAIWTIRWHDVCFPDFDHFQCMRGRVNNDVFLGMPIGGLKFIGHREFPKAGLGSDFEKNGLCILGHIPRYDVEFDFLQSTVSIDCPNEASGVFWNKQLGLYNRVWSHIGWRKTAESEECINWRTFGVQKIGNNPKEFVFKGALFQSLFRQCFSTLPCPEGLFDPE